MNYQALRVLATVYKILAWIILGAGSIISFSLLFSSNVISAGLGIPVTFSASLITALISEGFVLLQFVFFLGLAQLISLFFDIEQQTRPVESTPIAEKRAEKKAA